MIPLRDRSCNGTLGREFEWKIESGERASGNTPRGWVKYLVVLEFSAEVWEDFREQTRLRVKLAN